MSSLIKSCKQKIPSSLYGYCGFERGGVALRVILALITLTVMGMLIAGLLQNYQSRLQENHRKAVRISEYGLQIALNKLETQSTWTGDSRKTPYNGGWYAVTLRRFSERDTLFLEIKSKGHMGSSSDQKSAVLALIVNNGDSAWVPRSIH